MHEWALAEAVVEAAVNAAKKERLKKITKIVVNTGELQAVDHGIFRGALTDIIGTQPEHALLGGAAIQLGVERARFKCRSCDTEWTLADMSLDDEEKEAIHFAPEAAHAFIRCPSCKGPDFDMLAGREVSIASITGERVDA
jgi:hydrogenase nickel incorporation protein HypA/HybF